VIATNRIDATTAFSPLPGAVGALGVDCPRLSLGLTSWPIWGCEISSFPWTYDEQETCLLLEGDVSVTPDGGKPGQSGANANSSPALPPREHRGDGAQHCS
jgi:hypothetical protein